MLGQGLAGAAAGCPRPAPKQTHARLNPFHGTLKLPAAGPAEDSSVEIVIPRRISTRPASSYLALDRVQMLAESLDLLGRYPFRGQASGQTLQGFPEMEEVLGLILREAGDDHSPARPGFYEAFVRQALQGISNGRAADAQCLGQVGFSEGGASGELSAQDGFFERGLYQINQGSISGV